MAKAVLINPNNGAIDTRYDPNDIDDPFSYRARDGFMGIGPLWANNDDGTVYMQGHLVIPNPWGNVSTNGTTTTTTDDTTDKDGGDCENGEDCNSLLGQFAENWTLEQGWIAAKYRFIATGTIYTPKLLISIDLWYELEEQKFATEFFKMVFGEDFEQAVEEMYDREIKEHRDKWYDACIEMFRLRCEEIPRECSEIM